MSLSVLQLRSPRSRCWRITRCLVRYWFADGCLLPVSSLDTERNDHALVSLPHFFKYKFYWFLYYYFWLGGSAGKESVCNAGDLGLKPWVGKIPWRREQLPTPVFWPGGFHGQRRPAGYSPWGRRVGHGMTEQLSLLAMLGRHRCVTAFFSCSEWGLLSVAVRGLPLLWLLLLQSLGSRVAWASVVVA